MNWLNQHIVFRSILIALMMCLSMPCSAKQDIKKALNLTTYENVEKPNKNTTCQTVTEKSDREKWVTASKEIIENKTSFVFRLSEVFSENSDLYISEQPLSSTVPIYILHEQYRL